MPEVERLCNAGSLLAHKLYRTPADRESFILLSDSLQPLLVKARELLQSRAPALKRAHLPIARILRSAAMLRSQDEPLIKAALAAARNADPFPLEIAAMMLYAISRVDPVLRGDVRDLVQGLGAVLEQGFTVLEPDNRSRVLKGLAEMGDDERALRLLPLVTECVQNDQLPPEGMAAVAVSASLINSPKCLPYLNTILVKAARRRFQLTRTSNQRIVESFVTQTCAFQYSEDGTPHPAFSAACHPLPQAGVTLALPVLDLLSEMLSRNNVGPVEARMVPWTLAKLRLRSDELLRRLVAILLEERPNFHFYQFEKEAQFFSWEWAHLAWGYAEQRFSNEEAIGIPAAGITRSEEILCERLKSDQILTPMYEQTNEVQLMLAWAFTVFQQDLPVYYNHIRQLAEQPLTARELGMALHVIGRWFSLSRPLLDQAIERIDELSSREMLLALVGLEKQPAEAEEFAKAARHSLLKRRQEVKDCPPFDLSELAMIACHTPKTPDVNQFAALVANALATPPRPEFTTRTIYENLVTAFGRWEFLTDLVQRRIGRAVLLLRNGVFVGPMPHVDLRGYSPALAVCVLARCSDNKIRPFRLLFDKGSTEVSNAMVAHLEKTKRTYTLTDEILTVLD